MESMPLIRIALLLCLGMVVSLCAEDVSHRWMGLVPRPVQWQADDGQFQLESDTVLVVSSDQLVAEAEFLAEVLAGPTGFDLPVHWKVVSGRPRIELVLSTTAPDGVEFGPEGYHLQVEPDVVRITGAEAAGVFYGGQTLRQLFPVEAYAPSRQAGVDWSIPCGSVVDRPRFAWRGMMLDVSRHFFSTEYVKRYIDQLALHKINLFHWHLTDDDGWRLEIKAYPKLTEQGAWRGDDEVLPPSRGSGSERYGGFYTQDEIREIVAYAARRHISILPEIDMPGHSRAITATYPETLPTVFTDSKSVQGVVANAISPAREENYVMLEKVFAEVADLFPFEYIHIGGDEVNHKLWKDCPQIKALMEREGLKNLSQVQQYFTHRLEGIFARQGRKIIGWNEILHGGRLSQETAVMSWISAKPGIAAARDGHPVVMTPGPYTYFDMKYPGAGEKGHWWAGIVSSEKVYSFDPLGLEGLDDAAQSRVLGVQACLWTEFVDSPQRADYQTYPRLCALAEVAWTPQADRSWDDFRPRLGAQLTRLDHYGTAFRVPPPSALVDEGLVTVRPPFPEAAVHYTTDGSEPGESSRRYDAPFALEDPDQLKMQTILGARTSKVIAGAERVPFAEWTPTQCSETFHEVHFDATEAINRAGTWYLLFQYTRGGHKLVVESVQLQRNGQEIALDEHEGQAGSSHVRHRYRLPVPTYRSNDVFTVVASLRSDGGTNSYGQLVLDRSANLEPNVTVETAISHYGKHDGAQLADWDTGTFFWSNRPVRAGETVTWTFREPVAAGYVELRTGKTDDPNADIATDAVLEVSEDGEQFQALADFAYGTAKGPWTGKPLRAVRLRVTRDHRDQWLIVRELVLR